MQFTGQKLNRTNVGNVKNGAAPAGRKIGRFRANLHRVSVICSALKQLSCKSSRYFNIPATTIYAPTARAVGKYRFFCEGIQNRCY